MSKQEGLLPVNEWTLNDLYTSTVGKPLDCGVGNCKLGSYLIKKSNDGLDVTYSPACPTCEFAGGLGDVFNDTEKRFVEGAPECFKRGAAIVLTLGKNSPLGAIRRGRPDTAAIIDSYANH